MGENKERIKKMESGESLGSAIYTLHLSCSLDFFL